MCSLDARLKLRHLRLFVALDTHRNVLRAAESIGMSQPAASKMLSDVEKILGTRLFNRLPRGVEPNEVGAAVVRRSRNILAELDQASEEIMSLRSGESGAVNVGSMSAPGLELIVGAINAVRRKHPNIQIWVDVGTTEYLTRRVAEGVLDFAICWIPPEGDPPGLVFENIGEEKFNFICRAGHPLLKKKEVSLEDLVDVEWVLQSPGSLVRQVTDTLFTSQGLPPPERVINTTPFIAMLIFLRDTNAISVVSTAVANLLGSLGSFRILPYSKPFVSGPLGIVRSRNRQLTPSATIMFDAVIKEISQKLKQHDVIAK